MPKIIENIREKLILEGRKTLMEKSYRELSIRTIAKNSDIAIGTFYNYFKSKEDFVGEIFKDDWKATIRSLETLTDSKEELKEKIRKVYLAIEGFVHRYISIFYEIAMLEGYKSEASSDIKDIYIKVEEILKVERSRGNIKSELSSKKLTHFIVSNLIYLSKNKYITFDELYEHMKI
ncbi:transcriptional regulator [Clostridium acetobutylicum]|nr:transcriptional regulator [Clostridium acetobutylicum]